MKYIKVLNVVAIISFLAAYYFFDKNGTVSIIALVLGIISTISYFGITMNKKEEE